MRLSASLRYAAGVGYEAVELSYVGGALAMVVIVPTEGTFEGFESGLDGARLREIVGSLSPSEVQLRFPRFEFRTQAQLKAPRSASLACRRPSPRRRTSRA